MTAAKNILVAIHEKSAETGPVVIIQKRRISEVKRVKTVIIAGICLGVALLAVKIRLGIDSEAFMKNYWMAAPFLVIGAVAVYVGYQVYYQKKMHKLAGLLEKGKAKEYIDGLMKLRESAKGKNLQNVIDLNLAAGYVESKQYGAAVMILESLPEAVIRNENLRVVYCINLCMSYFEIGKKEKARKVYEENRGLFEKLRSGKMYGESITRLDEMMNTN